MSEHETGSDGIDLSDPEYYLNRELSKLEFNDRVLSEALDDSNPLLERVKFLSIFTRNMDEFFMKRVGGLKQQIVADVTDRTPDGRTPREQWETVIEKAAPMFERQAECYREEIRPALTQAGIEIVDYDDLGPEEQSTLNGYFGSSIFPTLTPLTFDPAHPFPHISNLSLSLAVLTSGDDENEPTFSRVKIPQNRPRLIQVGDATRYVLLEELIAANLDRLFPDVEILEYATFRVTRNAEVRRNEEVAEDLIEMVEEVLEERRFATVVRLEVERGTSDRILDLLRQQLDVSGREVFELPSPLDYREFEELNGLDRPELKVSEWTPQPHPRLANRHGDQPRDIFEHIRRDDVLVHHPYHSFADTVRRFIDEAANDPNVLAIKAAIYRTASESKIIRSLIDAADNGKQVAVMVELKARFDEEDNLEWAKTLEENGIHVAYGTIGHKTHTKTTLVVRGEDDGVELYSHVGTGNYHSETAKQYEDLGLLTANPDIGQDLVKLFNYFTGHSLHETYRELLIAPGNMREQFVELIRREATHAREGREARIVAKVNRLEDPEIVEELYRASRAGVDIDLIVRDICRLRPGLDNVSDTVNVISIVGRFLEHSRIFYFHDDGAGRYYIGSADWMERNLDNRVEAVTPIHDPDLQDQLGEILDVCLADNQDCWEMQSDGSYSQRTTDGDEPISVQETFMRQAENRIQKREP
jgi:polyphosphate kinase